jgi:hypothetical protein
MGKLHHHQKSEERQRLAMVDMIAADKHENSPFKLRCNVCHTSSQLGTQTEDGTYLYSMMEWFCLVMAW